MGERMRAWLERRWLPVLVVGEALWLLSLGWILGVLLSGCATTPPARPQLPPLPPPTDLGRLLPPAPAPVVIPSHVPRYPDTHVRAGRCTGLPAGILVSPAAYARTNDLLADRQRLAVEVAALGRARTAEHQAAAELEQACRARAADLEQAVLAAGRVTSWKTAALLVAGGLVGFAGGFLFAGGFAVRR